MTDNLHIPDPSGILAVHASAVCINGEALIFLGPSETGKSTICRLLSARTQPLADDAVYLIPRVSGGVEVVNADGGRAFAGPLSETQACALHGPLLRAIFRLYQAPALCLERIDNLQTGHHLTNAFFEIDRHRKFDIETKRIAFSGLATIARSVCGYHFYFDRSPRSLEAIANELGLKINDKHICSTTNSLIVAGGQTH